MNPFAAWLPPGTSFGLTSALVVVGAYLLGSLSFAVIVSRMMGLGDPRTYGSKNPGATNVLRSGNKVAALLTLLLDGAKGWLAPWLAATFAVRLGIGAGTVAAAAVAVVVGHLWPVFFRFKGGKGVATGFGALVALQPLVGGLAIAAWLAIALIFRYSSLAAIVAAVVAPMLAFMFHGRNRPLVVAVGVIGALLLWRHRQNLSNLVRGREPKIGETPTGRARHQRYLRLHDDAR